MSNPDALVEAYTQAFETMRYYGNLRFTVLTAFILMSGGLFTAALRPTKGLTMSFRLASFAGILLAIVFGTFEWRIAANFDFYGSKTEQIGRNLRFTVLTAFILMSGGPFHRRSQTNEGTHHVISFGFVRRNIVGDSLRHL